MKRLPQVAKELGISTDTIRGYLLDLVPEFSSVHDKIDPETEAIIKEIHTGKRKKPLLKPGTKLTDFETDEGGAADEIISIKDIPEEFNVTNHFSDIPKDFFSSADRFSNRTETISVFDGLTINTIFTDFEAFSICLGLEDKHLKFIARQYFKNPNNKSNHFEAHTLAMQALNKYGSKLLSYVLCLPPLPFKAFDATSIFSELDKRKKTHKDPAIRILFINKNGLIEKIRISFYAIKKQDSMVRFENVIVVKNRANQQLLMKVSRSGYLIPESNSKQLLPVIELFFRTVKDINKAILNYGLETGECSICGRELSDEISIKNGIGPVCARK